MLDHIDYFGFSADPFSIAPNPAMLYPSQQHLAALEELRYGLDRPGGFMLLTGDVGIGKTLLTRIFLQSLPSGVSVTSQLNSALSGEQLLRAICHDLGFDVPTDPLFDIALLHQKLYAHLLSNHRKGKLTLVVIDEAQNLSQEALESLRLLTNLETDTKKLLHVLLVGQSELIDTLSQDSQRQLSQRVIAKYHLDPLNESELLAYIAHRVKFSGGPADLFSSRAVVQLGRYSRGIPRLVNQLAERALLNVFRAGGKRVDSTHVDQAAQKIFSCSVRVPRNQWLRKGPSIFALISLIGVMSAFASSYWSKPYALPEVRIEEQKVSEEIILTIPLLESSVDRLLLQSWVSSIDSLVTENNLCDLARESGVNCLQSEKIGFNDIVRINRVGIVTIDSSNGGSERVLIKKVLGDEVTLFDGEIVQNLTILEFLGRWQGDLLLLWQPPEGYRMPLRPGVRDRGLISWLLARVQSSLPNADKLITGGRYSSALLAQVKKIQRKQGLLEDGVVGPHTIIQLNNPSLNPEILLSTD